MSLSHSVGEAARGRVEAEERGGKDQAEDGRDGARAGDVPQAGPEQQRGAAGHVQGAADQDHGAVGRLRRHQQG